MQLLVRCMYNYVAINLYKLIVATRENIKVSEGCEEQTEKETCIKRNEPDIKGYIPIFVVYTCMVLCTQARKFRILHQLCYCLFCTLEFYNRQSMVLKDEARFWKDLSIYIFSDGM